MALQEDSLGENGRGGKERRWIVAIEASTPATGIALAGRDGRLVAHVWHDGPLPASARMLGALDAMLREFDVKPGEIGAVAAGLGPGAFTGLRVALAQAKTLARAWDAHFYGFSTLAMLARRWPVAGDLVCPLLDARRGEVYSGLYRIGETGATESLRPDAVEPVESLLAALAARGDVRILLTGSGARRYRADLQEGLGERAQWIAPPLDDPAADALALAGAEALRRGEAGLDPLAAEPLYLRPSDAEKRHGIDVSGMAAEQLRT